MIWLVTYDISADETRNKVAELLKEYGSRVQFSCFEIECSNGKLKEIIKSIKNIIQESDSVHFYPLTKNATSNIIEIGIKRQRHRINAI